MLKRYALAILTLVFSAALLSFIRHIPTHALSCAPPNPENELMPVEHMDVSKYVFLGRVVSPDVTSVTGNIQQVFAVEDWIKGGSDPEVLVHTNGTWGVPLRENTRYILVYESSVEDGGGIAVDDERLEFSTPLCPGVNKPVIAQTDSEFEAYRSQFDQIRDNTIVQPQLAPLSMFNFGSSLFGVLITLLSILFGSPLF